MPAHSSPRPLRKVTLNLYDEDVAALERLVGHGWSSLVREWIHDHAERVAGKRPITKLTLGDIADGKDNNP